MNDIPMIGIAARGAGQGKTRLILALLEEFTRRGLKVAVLKHAQHVSWPAKKDSGLYMRHGALSSLVVAPTGWQLSVAALEEPNFAAARDILLQSCCANLLLTEGYKQGPQPKLLLTEESANEEVLLPHTVALVSKAPQFLPLPCFSDEDTVGIVDFIIGYCGIGGK